MRRSHQYYLSIPSILNQIYNTRRDRQPKARTRTPNTTALPPILPRIPSPPLLIDTPPQDRHRHHHQQRQHAKPISYVPGPVGDGGDRRWAEEGGGFIGDAEEGEETGFLALRNGGQLCTGGTGKGVRGG